MHVNTSISPLVCGIDFDRTLTQVIFGKKRIKIYIKQLHFKIYNVVF